MREFPKYVVCLEPAKAGYKRATGASSEMAVLEEKGRLGIPSVYKNISERFVKAGSNDLLCAKARVRSIGTVQPIAQTYSHID